MEFMILILFARCICSDDSIRFENIKVIYFILPSLFIMIMTAYFNSRVVDYGDFTKEDSLVNPGVLAYQNRDSYHPLMRDKSDDYLDNYSLISGIPSVNSYLHLFPAELLLANQRMGYDQIFTKVSGHGGTEVTDLITCFDSCWIGYYEGACESLSSDLFSNQNRLCEGFFGEDLFEEYCMVPDDDIFDISLDKSYVIYMYVPEAEESFINNLGVYDGTFHFERDADMIGEIRFGLFDIEEYESSVPTTLLEATDIKYTNRSLEFTLDNDESYSRLLFLPIASSSGWKLYVDGKRTEIHTIFDAFIGVDMPAGQKVNIRLLYTPPYLILGMCISIMGVLILLLDYRYMICNRLMFSASINIVYVLYMVIFIMIVFGVYFLNIAFSVLDEQYWYFLLKKRGV